MSAEHGVYIPGDPNITHFSTGHRIQRVTVHEDFMMVESPTVGSYVIGDRQDNGFAYDFLTTPNLYRSDGISQLCKTDEIATIPNTASFTRGWHVRDIHHIIDKISDRIKASVEQRVAYHLAADGDDQSHMVFSHATEQAIQSWGGPENYHEALWPNMAELGGTTAVLDKHEIPYDERIRVPGIEIPGWIDSSHPDVNVDRLQYAVAELLLWFDHDGAPAEVRETIRELCDLDNFEIDADGNMIFKDIEVARLFAKGYLLLSTEHWNDPINRVQLHLLIHATQWAISKRRIDWMNSVDKGETRRPENYLMGVDQDVMDALETGPGKADDFIYAVRNALFPIAMQERQRFIDYRLAEYSEFMMDPKARDYPSEYLPTKRVDFGPPSSQVEVDVKIENGRPAENASRHKLPRLDLSEEGITYKLSPLKNRYVDPLVKTADGSSKRLSELDPNYGKLLTQQQKIQRMGVTVRLAFAGGFENAFKTGVRLNDREFARIRKRSPMTDDQQRRVIEMAAARAQQINSQLGSLVLAA